MSAELCEWDPARDKPATVSIDERVRVGCDQEAVFAVGADGEWHLCEACLSLPRFSKFRVKKILRPAGAPESKKEER